MKQQRQTIAVLGAGWITGGRHGLVRGRLCREGDDPADLARRPEIFDAAPKNFPRFDAPSKVTCCLCALTLRDAGLAPAGDASATVGLAATSESGCEAANLAYFSDYIRAGRTLARGNLFIYTLPSSPLSEATIHFGLRGPAFYWGVPGGTSYGAALAELVGLAAAQVADGGAAAMLAASADAREGLCLALGPAPVASPVLSAAAAMGLLAGTDSVVAAARAVSRGLDGGQS